MIGRAHDTIRIAGGRLVTGIERFVGSSISQIVRYELTEIPFRYGGAEEKTL